MLDTVRLALGRPARRSKHYECRNCGTGLDPAETRCPDCDSTDVAIYEL